jgi:hypothetical protein
MMRLNGQFIFAIHRYFYVHGAVDSWSTVRINVIVKYSIWCGSKLATSSQLLPAYYTHAPYRLILQILGNPRILGFLGWWRCSILGFLRF